MNWCLLFLALASATLPFAAVAANNEAARNAPGDAMLAKYFSDQTDQISERCLNDITTLDDWNSRKPRYRQELLDMLGLWPLPEKTDLHPVITGKVETEQFVVEKLHFQSRLHLYVTANLYLPKNGKPPFPTVLYLCGHSKVVTNGVSYGNKTAYQHHGAWFARNGYACLVVDTLQLGEIEGIHHGTFREGMWWWNSRGYTPAGVEAWNNIRALDYLETRPEVDKTRIGVTGRSGGGSYSWVLTALDDRIKVAAPIAGITDLQNYVVDGCIEGHCDCMFFVNTYRWDYPLVAAMAAPRPLMLGNSDKDRIFPLSGIERLHAKVKHIYDLYGATNNFALLITDGPHADTQDLQLPVFRWFNRHLKGEDPVIEMAAMNFFEPQQLRVFDKLPEDQVNTKIHEVFVPKAEVPPVPKSREEWKPGSPKDTGLYSRLNGKRGQAFSPWTRITRSHFGKSSLKPAFLSSVEGLNFQAWDFLSQSNVTLRLYSLAEAGNATTNSPILCVLDEKSWLPWLSAMSSRFTNELASEKNILAKDVAPDPTAFKKWINEAKANHSSLFFFAPRGIGLSAWSGTDKQQIQIRRRFMLLGQTLDATRSVDIRRAVEVLQQVQKHSGPLTLRADRQMAVNALYVSALGEEKGIGALELTALPTSHYPDGPDYLGILRYTDIPQMVAVAAEETRVVLIGTSPDAWKWPVEAMANVGRSANLIFR